MIKLLPFLKKLGILFSKLCFVWIFTFISVSLIVSIITYISSTPISLIFFSSCLLLWWLIEKKFNKSYKKNSEKITSVDKKISFEIDDTLNELTLTHLFKK